MTFSPLLPLSLSLLLLTLAAATATDTAKTPVSYTTPLNAPLSRQSRFPPQSFTIDELQQMIDGALPPFCEDFQFFTGCACLTVFRFFDAGNPPGPLGPIMRILCREGFAEPELVLNNCIRVTTNNPVTFDVFSGAVGRFINECFPPFGFTSILELAQAFPEM